MKILHCWSAQLKQWRMRFNCLYFGLYSICKSWYYFLKLSVLLFSDELGNSLAECNSEPVYGTCTFSISPNDFHVVGWIINPFKYTTSKGRRKKKRHEDSNGYKNTSLHLTYLPSAQWTNSTPAWEKDT